jgi:2-polyprenyl-6-methoxyphenol hydroxylase-like FAD-dependent oxidoreductase
MLMKIAIVGAGVSGLTIASLLGSQEHEVTVFEQAPKCEPVGAGILLQPSGQLILKKLGLLEQIEQHSPKLSGLQARTRFGKEIVNIKYEKLKPGLYGLGVRRSLLFSLLLSLCSKNNVRLVENARIEKITQHDTNVEIFNHDESQKYDLLVAADGSRSALRKLLFPHLKTIEYQYAALWTLVNYSDLEDRLIQIVDGNKRLVGILPVEKELCSFFWGVQVNEKEKIWKSSLSDFKKQITNFDPALEGIADLIHSFDDLSYATYRHARLERYYSGRVVFIGDAAHSSSPHLGQGVNLALEDAFTLAQNFKKHDCHTHIFESYEKERFIKNKYYSNLTYLLAPFFQSDYEILANIRDLALPLMPKLPIVGTHMVASMSGMKNSWLDFSFKN